MKTCVFIVDYDNYGNIGDIKGEPKQHHYNIIIESLVESIATWLNIQNESIDEVSIRLYSGWNESGDPVLPNDRFMLVGKSFKDIRRKIGKTRLTFKRIDALEISQNKIFTATVKTRQFYRKISIPQERIDQCQQKDCKIAIVNEWLTNGCSGPCGLKAKNLLQVKEQKTIDTSITCDIIYFAYDNTVQQICIVSDDYDLVPAAIYARQLGKKVTIFRESLKRDYDLIISDCEFVPNCMCTWR